jgi:hypothetical protein
MLRILVMVAGLLVAATESPRAKTDPVALEVARKWLQAVASGEPTSVEKGTALPFTYTTTAKVKQCEGKVPDPKALTNWLKCLRTSNDLLVGEVQRGTLMPSDPPNVQSKALRSLGSNLSRNGKWIEAYINGDGVTYTFRFLIVDEGVAAFLVESEFETD